MFIQFLSACKAAWNLLPPWAQSAVNDFIAVVFIAIVALNLAIPGTLDEAKAEAFLILAAVVGVIEPWVRRHLPDAWGWLREQWAKA